MTPPKQAEVARLMRPPRGNQGISGEATRYIYIYTYIEFGHGPPWLRPDPDSARDTRSFEITMRQTVPRYDMGIESPKCRRKISRIRLAFGNFPISHPIYYRAKWGGIFCSGIFNHFPNSSFDDDRCVRFLPISQEGTDSK